MKKVLSTIILVCILLPVFAGEYITYDDPFRPVLSDFRTSGLDYTLYSDQARLAENYGFSLELPAVSGSLYNIARVMADDTGSQVLSDLFKGQKIQENLVSILGVLVEQMGYKANKAASLDLGFGFGYNSFAMGINGGLTVHSYNKSGTTVATLSAGLEANTALTFAYGRSVYNDGRTKINAGIAFRPTLKVFSSELNAQEVVKWNDLNLENIKVNSGYALPFDFTLTFSQFNGKLVFKVLASNINGTFYVNREDYSYTEIAEKLIPSSSAKLKTPMQIGASVVYKPGIRFIDPTVSVEFKDINGYLKTKVIDSSNVQLKNILMYLNADLNLNVLQILDLTAGIHGGYAYAGAGMGFGGNTIQVFYNWSEFGQELGEKPVDTFTVRVKLGYER